MLALGADIPPADPTLPTPAVQEFQTLKVQAFSLWNALLVGIVTGFAVSLGTVVFQRAARRLVGRTPP
jgi:hypothetical protein